MSDHSPYDCIFNLLELHIYIDEHSEKNRIVQTPHPINCTANHDAAVLLVGQ